MRFQLKRFSNFEYTVELHISTDFEDGYFFDQSILNTLSLIVVKNNKDSSSRCRRQDALKKNNNFLLQEV